MNTRLDMTATVARPIKMPGWSLGASETGFARCDPCGWPVSCESIAEAGARAEVHHLGYRWLRASRRRERRAA